MSEQDNFCILRDLYEVGVKTDPSKTTCRKELGT